jgi:hypothetical protein
MTETQTNNAPILIDLGKHKRRRVRKLKKGKPGRLMDKVEDCIEGLQSEGLSNSAQPVIVVVREKKKKRRRNSYRWWW